MRLFILISTLFIAACATSQPDVIVIPHLSPPDGGCRGFGDDVCCDSASMQKLVDLAAAQKKEHSDGG